MRSTVKNGLDKEIFLKFCPMQGLWAHRLTQFIGTLDNEFKDVITLKGFVETLRIFCRSDCLDQCIFTIFDLNESQGIEWSEMQMMLLNLPDLGFVMDTNYEIADEFNEN